MLQDKDRILKLLGSGLGGEVVSATVGCDPSYISQLMADEEFRSRVLAMRIESLTADTHVIARLMKSKMYSSRS